MTTTSLLRALLAMTLLSSGSLAFAQAPTTDEAGAAEATPTAEGEIVGEKEADPTSDAEAAPDPSVDRFRAPVDRLAEHYLGSTSRAVRFDWRRSSAIVALHASELLERNNFGSFRLGAQVRKPFDSWMIEGGLSYVFVLPTESSRLLALTPYRQPGRPSRVELELNVSHPLFEGVVTPLHDILPPAEMVLSATGGMRYLLYYETVVGDRAWDQGTTWTALDTWRDIGEGLFAPQLRDSDRVVLERHALGGMGIDPAILHALVGLTFDSYFQPGLMLSSRALIAVPILAPVSGTRLGFWFELGLAAGWAF